MGALNRSLYCSVHSAYFNPSLGIQVMPMFEWNTFPNTRLISVGTLWAAKNTLTKEAKNGIARTFFAF